MNTKNFIVAGILIPLVGCSTVSYDNSPGKPSVYSDTTQAGPIQGVGVESQDISAMADQMVRDILSSGAFANRSKPPRISIDNSRFINESNNMLNTNRIVRRLRVQLNRAARGRIIFIDRQQGAAGVAMERELKRSGAVDGGTIRRAKAPAGVDYFLEGKITGGDLVSNSKNIRVRESEFFFALLDAEYGSVIWENFYDYRKATSDNVIYR